MMETLIFIMKHIFVTLLSMLVIYGLIVISNNNTVEIKQSQSTCCPELTRVNWCWPWDSCYIIEDVCKESGGNKEG